MRPVQPGRRRRVRVVRLQIDRAVAFIAATVLGTDPATRASALAASLPEAISIAWNSRSTV